MFGPPNELSVRISKTCGAQLRPRDGKKLMPFYEDKSNEGVYSCEIITLQHLRAAHVRSNIPLLCFPLKITSVRNDNMICRRLRVVLHVMVIS